ncbi:MAG: Fic/DOC family protein [Pelagibacterales bacterium]|nr:Fic/DOC family protein [Pelagibacterales bacterium]
MTRSKLTLKFNNSLSANSKTVIYQAKDGAISLKTDNNQENVWASQLQIAELFKIDQSVVSRHINKIFKDDELDEKSNMQKMHIAKSDKPVSFYSLDVILAVGYRTNSKTAVDFRKWATKILKSYIVEGYLIDKKHIAKNYEKFIETLNEIKALSAKKKDSDLNPSFAIDLVKGFAETWLSLDAYDKDNLKIDNVTKDQITLSAKDLAAGIANLKSELIKKREATEIFAKERSKDALEGIIGNVMQSFGGDDLYESLEEKAAHLFYFIVKNHPFTDGNKRSGAFSFVWFLQKFSLIDVKKIDPQTLTALTLLIAESDPKDKDKMVGLVMMLLGNARNKL